MSTKFLDIFVIFLIFCPIPHIYLYFSWIDTSDSRQHYDVYGVPYGREQIVPESASNCSRCLSLISEGTDIADCIGADYDCAIKLSLQSMLKYFEVLNGINSADDASQQNCEATTSSIKPFAFTPEHGVDSKLLYGMMTGEQYTTFDYLTGEWTLSGETANDHPVWTKYDKYGRNLKLFLYDDHSSRRWIVGHNISSDQAFVESLSLSRSLFVFRDEFRAQNGTRCRSTVLFGTMTVTAMGQIRCTCWTVNGCTSTRVLNDGWNSQISDFVPRILCRLKFKLFPFAMTRCSIRVK